MGVVYLLQCDDSHTITHKIGYTKGSIKDRIRALQVGNGYEITELCSFKTEFGQKLETTVHRHFDHCRLKGEWFSLAESDINEFLNVCSRIENNFNSLKDNPFFH